MNGQPNEIIQWSLPITRSGMGGIIDKLIGPGATRDEKIIQVFLPALATIVALFWARQSDNKWTLIQFVLCGMLCFDMVGGIATNATSSAKRWFHREGQGFWNHFGFVGFHLTHLSLVTWFFLNGNLLWLAFSSSYLLVAAILILRVPLYLQRPIALLSYAGTVPLTTLWLDIPNGLEWFLPLFYLKLLVSHLPKEEPYRPRVTKKLGPMTQASKSSKTRLSSASFYIPSSRSGIGL